MKSIIRGELFKRVSSGLILGFCFFGAYLHSPILFSLILLAILLIILCFEWPKLIPIRGPHYWILTFFYPILPIATLIFLNLYYRSIDILFPLYPFIVSWVSDTGGFVFGKLWGKNKICPAISPKKSWEGFAGSLLAVLIFHLCFLPGIKVFPFVVYLQGIIGLIALSVLFTLVAFLGDISISYLKRKQGLKDTGHLLPGHGGLLDRFDAVLLVLFLGI